MPFRHIFFCFLCNFFLFFSHLYVITAKEVTFLKKIIILLFVLFVFCACGENDIPDKETTFIPSIIENEEKTPVEQGKIILALPHYLDENMDLSAGAPIGKRTDIPFSVPETYNMEKEKVMEIEIPPELLVEIKASHPDFEISENWESTLTYYSADYSAGMIKIIYVIGDKIVTDKAIICTIENGKIIRISYTNMDASVDEEKLLEKVENFENTTVQTKKVFEEGELFLDEEITYRYCFNAGKLIYCYQLYFYEDTPIGQVINNEYASEYFIE